MVALDGGRLAAAGFDHIGVDGSLGQILHMGKLLCLRFKDPDELCTYDLALLLGIGDAFQGRQKTILSVDANKVQIPVLKGGFHFVPFVFAHETVIHKDAVELPRNSLGKQRRTYGGIHTAGERQQHMVTSYLLPGSDNELLFQTLQSVVPFGAADIVQEVAQNIGAFRRALYLRVELDAVQLFLPVLHGSVGAGRRPCHGNKALRQNGDLIRMAHKPLLLFLQPGKE